ncbi:MAG: Zn-ribbon domain-containing OB-fold protein [Nitrospinota bacterium]
MPPGLTVAGFKCSQCGYTTIQRKFLCPACGNSDFNPMELAGRGTLYSFTRVHVGTELFKDKTPYLLAIVELEGGPRVTGRVLEPEGGEPRVGQAVELIERGPEGFVFITGA